MLPSLSTLLLSALALSSAAVVPSAVEAKDYAVIVAGSAGYDNYRHQADACHAYHVVRSNGVPDSQIIVMMQDDIASDPSNPFPGKVFNKPTEAGTAGVDVYAGCKKDYTGSSVTPAAFLAVLTGDATASGGKPVLTSTKEDRVFVNFVDHGGTGIIAFPDGSLLYAADLNNALQTAAKKQLFSKLVFYMEACESGSMFDGILPSNISVYATTASNPDESSWGTYCPPSDSVNGVELNSCLGDLYSVNWMEDADKVGPSQTLDQQFAIVVNETAQSHVMRYGDQSFVSLPIGDFEGAGNADNHIRPRILSGATLGGAQAARSLKASSSIDSREIGLNNAYYRYIRSSPRTEDRKKALLKLQKEVQLRLEADELFEGFATQFTAAVNKGGMNLSAERLFQAAKLPVTCDACCKAADAAINQYCGGFNDYSLQYHRVIVNACEATSHEASHTMVSLIKHLCHKQPNVVQM